MGKKKWKVLKIECRKSELLVPGSYVCGGLP
jgi:hypothetical protein